MELCLKFPQKEWSGLLFFSHTGDLKDISTLAIKCEELLLLDIGTGAYTEYDIDEEVGFYLFDNPHLTQYNIGHIHSHHNMQAFFSATDNSELQESTNENRSPFFLSLIVANSGLYQAAIGIKANIQTKSHITFKNVNDEEISFIQEKNECVILKSMISVNGFSCAERITALEEKQKAKKSALTASPFQKTFAPNSDTFESYIKPKQKSLPFEVVDDAPKDLAKAVESILAKAIALSLTYRGNLYQALQTAQKSLGTNDKEGLEVYIDRLELLWPTLLDMLADSVPTIANLDQLLLDYINESPYKHNTFLLLLEDLVLYGSINIKRALI